MNNKVGGVAFRISAQDRQTSIANILFCLVFSVVVSCFEDLSRFK